MLISKNNPIGLDVLIDKLQVKLYELSKVWDCEVTAFPRCLINYNGNKRNIEYYDNDNDYKTVLFAEDTKFFFTQERPFDNVDSFGFTANVDLYFMIDFSDKSDPSKRNDYELISDVVDVIHSTSAFTINEIDTDFKRIFSNTEFIDETDNVQPFYSFKIGLKSERFDINLKKCLNGC